MPFVDFIEQRLKSDLVVLKILAMDEMGTREPATQVLWHNEFSRSILLRTPSGNPHRPQDGHCKWAGSINLRIRPRQK